MYFLPRNNRFYSYIVHIRPVYRYLLSCLLAVACWYVWFFGIYTTLDGVLSYYHYEIQRLKQQNVACQQASSERRKLEHSVASMQKNLQAYADASHTAHDKIQKNLTKIIETASQVGAVFLSCSTEKEYDKQWHIEQAMTLECAGSFEQLMVLYDTWCAAKCMMTIQAIELENIGNAYYKARCKVLISALK